MFRFLNFFKLVIPCLLSLSNLAIAQVDGVAPTPFFESQQLNPLNFYKFRVGIPTLTRGPGNDFIDEPITFVNNCGTSGLFCIYGSGQVPWETTSSSMTSGYSGQGGLPSQIPPQWSSGETFSNGSSTYYGNNVYSVSSGGTAGSTPPTCTSGSCSDGNLTWVYNPNLRCQSSYSTTPASVFCSSLNIGLPNPLTQITAVTGHNTDQCGDWVNSSYKNPYDGLWYLLVHNEGPCDYAAPGNDTDESMSMWVSNLGAKDGSPSTWSPMAVPSLSSGTIISSDNPLTPNWIVGIGDCTMFPDAITFPQYMYMFCGHYSASSVSDYKNLIARAPIKTLGPGNWMLYNNGCYCTAALNNHFDQESQRPNAFMFDWVGSYAATMPSVFPIMTMAYGHVVQPVNDPASGGESINGLSLSVSTSLTTPEFKTLLPPLLNFDQQNFTGRPINYDGYFYQILRNDVDGSSVLNPGHFNLAYMLVAANNDLNYRWVGIQNVTMSKMTLSQVKSGVPQVGIQLETWSNTSSGNPASGYLRTTTFNPAAADNQNGGDEYGQWVPQSSLGYMMTMCPNSTLVNKCDVNAAKYANQIEECVYASKDDHMLEIDTNGTYGSCNSGWQHVRTVGWLYSQKPTEFPTNAIYACFNSTGQYHVSIANDSNCGGLGLGSFLGYALIN
jgi:hypothetical protein